MTFEIIWGNSYVSEGDEDLSKLTLLASDCTNQVTLGSAAVTVKPNPNLQGIIHRGLFTSHKKSYAVQETPQVAPHSC